MAQVGSGKWGTLPNASRWKPHRPRRVIAANVNREGRRAPTRSISTRHEAPSSKHQAPVKFQIPSSKFQENSKHQVPNTRRKIPRSLELSIWELFGCWDSWLEASLVLSVWVLEPFGPRLLSHPGLDR